MMKMMNMKMMMLREPQSDRGSESDDAERTIDETPRSKDRSRKRDEGDDAIHLVCVAT